MKLLAHPDPVVLEQELLTRLGADRRADALDSALVLVPTLRLAGHVQRRMAEHSAVWLGVEVLQLNTLTHRLLERPGAARVAALSPRLEQTLLEQVLERLPENRWSRYARRRPGAVRRLLRGVRDLREAGIDPDGMDSGAEHPREADLAEIYRAYTARLTGLRRAGFTDEAGRVREACRHAAAYARRFDRIFLHGAYELIGSHLDLVRELDRAREVTALLPLQTGAPATRYAETFAAAHLPDRHGGSEPLRSLEGRSELASLYDEERRPEPAPDGVFRFRDAQGAAAEVRVAVRRALRAVADGCPPAEVVIAARTLEPFAAALEETLDDEGLAWTSPLSSPLRRQPLVRHFLLLLEVLTEGFPRRSTAELLRSRLLDWSRLLTDGEPPSGVRADPWSREARILGGLDEWTDGLRAWAATPRLRGDESPEQREQAIARAADRAAQAGRIGDALVALRDRVEPDTRRTWRDHAERLRELVGTLFPVAADEGSDAARAALLALFDEMATLGVITRKNREVSLARARGWLVDAVGGSGLQLRSRDDGGFRVLDAMQLRGVTCRRLLLLGMNSGIFPRRPGEDSILPDPLRERLRERSGRPLPLRSRSHEEERQLLLTLLGAATERVEVSWQRADESGRARTPSLALREVGRLVFGRPDLRRVVDASRRISSHPAQQMRQVLDHVGLLSPAEARLLAALESSGPGAIESLARRFDDLADGLAMLRATESFVVLDPSYDGRLGREALPQTFSVSAMETLGTCPLKYLFQRVLRVRELEEEANPFEITPREMGDRVHAVLEAVYGQLSDEGLFARGDAGRLVRRGRELVEAARETLAGELGLRIAQRTPVLWNGLVGHWLDVVRAFVERDLDEIALGGFRPDGFEQDVSGTLDLGRGVVLSVRGRLDRRLAAPDGFRVGDYKASKHLKDRVSVTKMLKGQALQVPLYHLLSEDAGVDILGVHPELDPADSATRRSFDGFKKDEQRDGFRETLRVLRDLPARGVFPFRPDRHCTWCAYEQACRRQHPPSRDREKTAPDSRLYRELQSKNARGPLLEPLPPGGSR